MSPIHSTRSHTGKPSLCRITHGCSIDNPPQMGRDIDYCKDCETFVARNGCHKPLFVFVDGACANNGSPGATGGVGVYFGPGSSYNISQPLSDEKQTSQRAELTAAIRAIETAKSIAFLTYRGLNPDVPPEIGEKNGDRCIKILTDSQYLVDAFYCWIPKWESNGYRTAHRTPVVNTDLFRQLAVLKYSYGHDFCCLEFCKISREENSEADALAKQATCW